MYTVQTFSPLTRGTRHTRTYGLDDDTLLTVRDDAVQWALLLTETRADAEYALVWQRRGPRWGICFDTRHGYY
jgi:hypothetical protein